MLGGAGLSPPPKCAFVSQFYIFFHCGGWFVCWFCKLVTLGKGHAEDVCRFF